MENKYERKLIAPSIPFAFRTSPRVRYMIMINTQAGGATALPTKLGDYYLLFITCLEETCLLRTPYSIESVLCYEYTF